jgi:hypothetical protein
MRKHLLWLAPLVVLAGLAAAAPPLRPKPPPPEGPTNSKPPPLVPGAKNLVPNGDFEQGDVTPTGWQTIDGLSTFWVKDADPAHGKVLKIDTDIYQSQAYDWWVKLVHGASPRDAPKKTVTVGDKYDTLAGLDGVWFWSDFIPVEKGKAYWFTVDAKGPGGGLLAWLFGYPEKTSTAFGADEGAFQEYLQGKTAGKLPDRSRGFESFIHKYKWKGQLSSLAGSSPTEWKTFSRRAMPFRPTANTPDVRFVRVMLYAYWPPGVYYFDNVKLYEVQDPKESR